MSRSGPELGPYLFAESEQSSSKVSWNSNGDSCRPLCWTIHVLRVYAMKCDRSNNILRIFHVILEMKKHVDFISSRIALYTSVLAIFQSSMIGLNRAPCSTLAYHHFGAASVRYICNRLRTSHYHNERKMTNSHVGRRQDDDVQDCNYTIPANIKFISDHARMTALNDFVLAIPSIRLGDPPERRRADAWRDDKGVYLICRLFGPISPLQILLCCLNTTAGYRRVCGR